MSMKLLERFSRAGPRGRGREWATLGVHPLSWLLSNNRLEKVPFVSVLHTSSSRLLLSNQDKGCTPSVAHSLPLPLDPALLNLWTNFMVLSYILMGMRSGVSDFTPYLTIFLPEQLIRIPFPRNFAKCDPTLKFVSFCLVVSCCCCSLFGFVFVCLFVLFVVLFFAKRGTIFKPC